MRKTLTILLTLAATGLFAPGSSAQQPVSFAGQTITLLIGQAAGGGTDNFGRALAQHLSRTLQGAPAIVVQNMPGADGIVGLNHFAARVKPDGLTFTVGAQAQVDPLNVRKKTTTYDPSRFAYVGGAGRAGTALVLNKSAVNAIRAGSGTPVNVGALTAVRSGMQIVLWGGEYLNWNVRWVLGYRSTAEVNLALERGEVDMTSIPVITDVQKVMATGKFELFVQSGIKKGGRFVSVKEFEGSPLISDLLNGKLKTDIERDAFNYWINNASVGQFVALPEGTPEPIVEAYRAAYEQSMHTDEMKRVTTFVSGDFLYLNGTQMAATVKDLARTSQEAIQHIISMGNKQGITIE
jgi:hypothetical protein